MSSATKRFQAEVWILVGAVPKKTLKGRYKMERCVLAWSKLAESFVQGKKDVAGSLFLGAPQEGGLWVWQGVVAQHLNWTWGASTGTWRRLLPVEALRLAAGQNPFDDEISSTLLDKKGSDRAMLTQLTLARMEHDAERLQKRLENGLAEQVSKEDAAQIAFVAENSLELIRELRRIDSSRKEIAG